MEDKVVNKLSKDRFKKNLLYFDFFTNKEDCDDYKVDMTTFSEEYSDYLLDNPNVESETEENFRRCLNNEFLDNLFIKKRSKENIVRILNHHYFSYNGEGEDFLNHLEELMCDKARNKVLSDLQVQKIQHITKVTLEWISKRKAELYMEDDCRNLVAKTFFKTDNFEKMDLIRIALFFEKNGWIKASNKSKYINELCQFFGFPETKQMSTYINSALTSKEAVDNLSEEMKNTLLKLRTELRTRRKSEDE